MAGLYAFFYGTMHLLTYVIADRFSGLDFPDGMLALSTARNLAKSVGGYLQAAVHHDRLRCVDLDGAAGDHLDDRWIRRLAGKRWHRLHRLVYLTGILGPLHYFWLVKADVRRPLIYAFVVAALLGTRVVLTRVRRPAPPPSARRM
jgi:sulfoxide reductase heme-binding subunit YedZ